MSSAISVVFAVLCSLVLAKCKTYPFYCDFKLNSLCGMQNGNPIDPIQPAINFTIQTYQTVTYPDLGPSTNQPFMYWSRSENPPETELTNGEIHTARFNQSKDMCVQFSYYINSTGINNNTWLDISAGGCYGASLYFIEKDYTHGWQVITVPLHDYTCAISLYITVNQLKPARVAIAFDYIIVDLCEDFDQSTTTTLPYNNAATQTWHTVFISLFLFQWII